MSKEWYCTASDFISPSATSGNAGIEILVRRWPLSRLGPLARAAFALIAKRAQEEVAANRRRWRHLPRSAHTTDTRSATPLGFRRG